MSNDLDKFITLFNDLDIEQKMEIGKYKNDENSIK